VINRKHNCLHIHIPRSAGLSINNSLFSTDISEKLTAVQYRNLFGDLFTDFFKFGFVRNPWDRLVSIYCYCKNTRLDVCGKLLQYCVSKYGGNSFSEFINLVEHIVNHDSFFDSGLPIDWKLFLQPQYYWLHDGDELLVDFVGRYERLHGDYNKVCDHIGLQDKRNRLSRIGYTKNRFQYRGYYNTALANKVKSIYLVDCEAFAYKF